VSIADALLLAKQYSAEGPFTCSNTTIRSNDIGPCGSDNFQQVRDTSALCLHRSVAVELISTNPFSPLQWSDGISLSCADSLVENNHITDATDAGIVVFGSPGSTIRNNTIQATDVSIHGISLYRSYEGGGTDSSLF